MSDEKKKKNNGAASDFEDDTPTVQHRVLEPTDPDCAAFCRIGAYIAMALSNAGGKWGEMMDEVRKGNRPPTIAQYGRASDSLAELGLTLTRGSFAIDESRDRRRPSPIDALAAKARRKG